MRILVTGATGFIGSALAPILKARGHEVVPLARCKNGDVRSPWWDPERNQIDLSGVGDLDAVVHLAGENIAARWTAAKKRRLYESRVNGTRLLATELVKLPAPPKCFIAASGIAYYGSRGADLVDESSPRGTGFLADLSQAWEQASEPIAQKGIRIVFSRFGLVLGKTGGALAKMLPPFRLGLGGKLGSGQQYWSWITIDDAVEVISMAIENNAIRGPINVVAGAVTNQEFTATLGRVLRRPTFFAVPAFVLGLIFTRQMANEVFLSSVRVRPRALEEHGYRFKFLSLEGAFRRLLTSSSEKQ